MKWNAEVEKLRFIPKSTTFTTTYTIFLVHPVGVA